MLLLSDSWHVSEVSKNLSGPLPALPSRGGSRGESTKISNAVIPLFVAVSFNGTAQHSLVVECQILRYFGDLLDELFNVRC